MQLSSQIQQLTHYFGESHKFYYLILDLYGNCKYINPVLFNKLGFKDNVFEKYSSADIFSQKENYNFKIACENCLQDIGSLKEVGLNLMDQQGVHIFTRWEISTIHDISGKAEYLQAIGHDAEDFQFKVEDKLLESELFYKNLIAESLDGIVLSNIEGVIDFASPSIKKILGYNVEDVIGKTLFDFAYPDDVGLAWQTFNEEIKSKQEVNYINIRLIKKNGELLWCKVRGHNMLENPFVRKMVICFSDDSFRKFAEETVLESEKKFKAQATILRNVTDVIVTVDLNRLVTSWNTVIEKLTGVTAEEAIGKRYKDVIATDYSPFTHDQVVKIVMQNGIWRGEISYTHTNGDKTYFLHTVSLLYSDIGERIGMLGVGKDITDRKKAETRLQQSELFYRSLSYYSIDGIVMSDKNGVITYCGPSVERISGYEPTQLLGHNFFEFVHPEDVAAATDAFFKELNKESVLNYMFLRLKHSNGEWTWCTVRAHNLLNAPELNTVIIYFTNDTNRKEAEDQLRKSEEKFRNLIINLKQGVILLNEKGDTMICNQAALEMLGRQEKEVIGRNLLEYDLNIITEDGKSFSTAEHPIDILHLAHQSFKDVVIGIKREGLNDPVWVLINAEPVFGVDGGLSSIVCSLTDISEQKRLTNELFEQEVQKQKMLVKATIDSQEKERQEIGKELHDNINQYLTTARLYLEVAKEKSSGDVLNMIDLSHKTLSDIVKEIRKISQSLVPPTLGDIGLIESVHELFDSIKLAHKIKIDFRYRYFDESAITGNVKLSLFRIIQEQMNNILKHSMAEKMEVSIQSDAEFVFLKIIDDGKGFDLKNYKKGRGLGNINSRAHLFDGKMKIETAPGKGCTLSVTIPAS